MADGFYVDFGALHDAAEGITDTLDAMATKKVSDIDAPRSAFGHDGLAGTVADFCDRWEIGVEHLTKDAEAVVGRLNDAVGAYLRVDSNMQKTFAGFVRQPGGPDPAAE